MLTESDSNIIYKNQKVKTKATRFLKKSLVNNPSLSSYYEPLIQAFLPLWSNKKHRARVLKIDRITKDIIQITLKPNRHWQGFQAGQYLELTVIQNGAWVTRCFSISSSTQHWHNTGEIELTIREQDHGRVTPWLIKGLTKNSYVQISQAKGTFVFENSPTPKLLIAGGTGITPMKSLLCSHANNHSNGNITDLLYFSRGTHLFKDELLQLGKLHPSINIHLIDSQTQGHFSLSLLEHACPDYKDRTIYLCGPASMSQAITELLRAQGVSEDHLVQEHFLAIRSLPSDHQNIQTHVDFIKAGQKTQTASKNNQTLLELAEEARLSPDYGCRMGICHQCKCTKTKGVVLNTLTGETSDTSKEDIQLCVSIPMSDVEIDM